jgi:hypothetical protein
MAAFGQNYRSSLAQGSGNELFRTSTDLRLADWWSFSTWRPVGDPGGVLSLFLPRFHPASWLLLLAIASLITPILMIMALLIYGASILKHYLSGNLQILKGTVIAILTGVVLLLVMWQAGYFLISTVGGAGFGYYRANVLTLIDPGPNPQGTGLAWSRVLAIQPKGDGDYEGFCFLGIGPILLAVCAFGSMLRAGLSYPTIDWKKFSPLLIVVLACGLFSFSNSVAVGNSVTL